MVRKHFCLEQNALVPSVGRPSMHDCFNQLENSSNYSACVVQTNVASSIAGKVVKSQMLYLSQQWCLLHYSGRYIPCFIIVPPCIGLKWCSNVVIVFLICWSIHISTVKQPKQNKWVNKWQNQSSMLPSIRTLLRDAFGLRCSFLWLLSKTTHSFA